MQKQIFPKKAMPSKFLQFAPELPQFTYSCLVQCLIFSSCNLTYLHQPILPTSGSSFCFWSWHGTYIMVPTSMDHSLTTQSSPTCEFPPQAGPCASCPTTPNQEWQEVLPKWKEFWGTGTEMHREKSGKLNPKLCDEIPNRTTLLPCYYKIFLQVRKNIWHK